MEGKADSKGRWIGREGGCYEKLIVMEGELERKVDWKGRWI